VNAAPGLAVKGVWKHQRGRWKNDTPAAQQERMKRRQVDHELRLEIAVATPVDTDMNATTCTYSVPRVVIIRSDHRVHSVNIKMMLDWQLDVSIHRNEQHDHKTQPLANTQS